MRAGKLVQHGQCLFMVGFYSFPAQLVNVQLIINAPYPLNLLGFRSKSSAEIQCNSSSLTGACCEFQGLYQKKRLFVGYNIISRLFAKSQRIGIHIKKIILQLKCNANISPEFIKQIRIRFHLLLPIMAPIFSEAASNTAVLSSTICR